MIADVEVNQDLTSVKVVTEVSERRPLQAGSGISSEIPIEPQLAVAPGYTQLVVKRIE